MNQEFAGFLASVEAKSLGHLRDMVGINSFTFNRAGLNQVVGYCADLFKPLGFNAQRVPSRNARCGDHLFLTRPGKGPHRLVLVAHLDTVFPPEQEKEDGHVWLEEGDRIYGPGTADMKGGIVLIHMILQALREKEPVLFDSIHWSVLINATEETGCEDFPPLARAHADPGTLACLVYECGFVRPDGPKNSTLCVSRKGSARFHLEVEGKAAHSGENHAQGASAVREIARKIEQIESWTDYAKQLTLNVGVVSGGKVVNTVPPSAACDIDLRAVSPEDFKKGQDMILSLAGPGTVRSADGSFTCQLKVHSEAGYPPWPENDPSHELFGVFSKAAEGLGLRLAARKAGGASDGNHFYDLVPTVDELGPLGANIHCSIHRPEKGLEREYVLRSSFVERALLSLEVIQALAGRAGSR